jgi:hypothetical protein
MGGGGGASNLRLPFTLPQSHHDQMQGFQAFNAPAMAALAVVIAVCILAIILVFFYVSSRMRFVLFDSVVARECRIRQYWRQRAEPAFAYFLWQLLFGVVTLVAIGVVLGPALILAALEGWFQNPGAHLAPVILTVAIALVALILLIVAAAVIQVLTKDFVVPQMALEGVTVRHGWTRLWSQMSSDKVGYAAYIGMKIVMTIATMIMTAIIGFIVLLIVLIPVGGVGLIAVVGGAAAGMTWNPITIAIAVAVGGTVLLSLMFIFAMISVPLVVFFPAYSIYFLAGRYPPLQAALTTQG